MNSGRFIKGFIPWNKGLKTGLVPKSAFKKGQHASLSTEFKRGSSGFIGKHTEESKRKNREAHLGKKQSASTIAKRTTRLIGKKRTAEQKAKISGINNYRWIKDRTKLKTDRLKAYDVLYRYWMLEVKKRDNWKCKISNEDCNSQLEAHHILSWRDYPELRYEINNGITLCHAHHPRKRAEEKLLIPDFQRLIGVSTGN